MFRQVYFGSLCAVESVMSRSHRLTLAIPFKVLIVMKTVDDYFVNVKINEGFFFHLFFVLTFCNISAIFVLTFL